MKALLVLLIAPALVLAGTSANYTITPETDDGGGQRVSSANYTLDPSAAPGAARNSANYALRLGFAGALYDVTALTLDAAPLTLNETATRQLAAWQLLDDATFLAVAAAAVNWSVVSGPIASINGSGLATAGSVYQSTAATVQGSFGGFTDSLGLTVLNVTSDDFGLYAADGIADDWQVQYFGAENPNAAPGIDADADGQNNVLEFRAGYIPTDPASRFISRGLGFSGANFVIELSRVQPGTRYIFQRTMNFTTWTDVLTLDPSAVVAPFSQPLPAPDSRNFYRVKLEPQP